MRPEPNAGDDEMFAAHGAALADAIDAALPRWVVDSVRRIAEEWQGTVDPVLLDEAAAAGERARAEVTPRVRALLALDVDAQRTTPLTVLREAVVHPTAVLRGAGVPPLRRDALVETHFPDDDYDLTIVAYSDLGPEVGELGLVWGAAKAHVHLRRRRSEGQ